MSESNIRNMISEAEIYHSQGLLTHAGDKYVEIIEILKTRHDLPDKNRLLSAITGKLRTVQEDLEELRKDSDNPQLSEEQQDLIRNIFSYSKSKTMAAMEGAVALAHFGQHEKALIEFQSLLKNDMIPKMVVAKNILRCHLTLDSPRTAIDQVKEWALTNTFTPSELTFLRDFLMELLKGEEIFDALADLEPNPPDYKELTITAEEFSEISSVRFRVGRGRQHENMIDLDVAYQMGNTVSFHIKSNRKDMLSRFNPGDRFDLVQCYSSKSLFNTSGIISNKTKIASGPRKGDYTVELTINDP